ncbi:MAG: hypothetical protein JWQ38_2601 [Flavipsychrobacter sp.]|nr:hypothetical protein [Flavipsychrobacter sp.]
MSTYEDRYTQVATPLTTPFEAIALAFSGGGFRAASFSLGSLCYLNSLKIKKNGSEEEQPLLEKVTYISSASGGTITNAMYALHKAKGHDFDTFYKAIYKSLDGDDILNVAIDFLNDKRAWNEYYSYKSRNIINAFAKSYDTELLFNGATIGDLAKPEFPSHLEEVCFNSTEFFTGLPFRQQVKMQHWAGEEDARFYFGNENVHLDGDVVNKLKLADVLAASSCFPGGYEPLELPRDFCYLNYTDDNEPDVEKCLTPEMLWERMNIAPQRSSKKEYEFIKNGRVGLMDGGVTDNQGLESVMEADERRRNGNTAADNFNPFDLILINDVGSFFMAPYVVPGVKDNHISLLTIDTIVLLLALVMGVGFVSFYMAFMHNHIWFAMLGSIGIIVPAVLIYPWWRLHGKIKDRGNRDALNLQDTFSQEVIDKLLKFMRKTPVSLLSEVNKSRFNSVMILTNDVFMKRIRQILFESFYHNPIWNHRRKCSHIYDLSYTNAINRIRSQESKDTAPVPSHPIQR